MCFSVGKRRHFVGKKPAFVGKKGKHGTTPPRPAAFLPVDGTPRRAMI